MQRTRSQFPPLSKRIAKRTQISSLAIFWSFLVFSKAHSQPRLEESGEISAHEGQGIFGDLTDGAPLEDSEEKSRRQNTSAYKKAFDGAKKTFCKEGRTRFSFTWEGEVELHGCMDPSQGCYYDFTVYSPGSSWKCSGSLCKCRESGDIEVTQPSPAKK
jgi:hypothetical protein